MISVGYSFDRRVKEVGNSKEEEEEEEQEDKISMKA